MSGRRRYQHEGGHRTVLPDPVALRLDAAVLAVVFPGNEAIPAVAAALQHADKHGLPDGKPLNAGADAFDPAGRFVPDREGNLERELLFRGFHSVEIG
jgi:hypothetical protein